MKPNYETGSADAREIIDEALVYLIDLLADAVGRVLEDAGEEVNGENGEPATAAESELTPGDETITDWTRAFYAGQDPEIRAVLEGEGRTPTSRSTTSPTGSQRPSNGSTSPTTRPMRPKSVALES